MPTATYIPLATITLSSAANSVIFSSIPATYKDLILVATGSTASNQDISIRLNNDSGNNYSFVYMGGSGSGSGISGSSSAENKVVLDAYFWRSSEISSVVAQIMDYSATDKHKTVLSRNNVAGGGVDAFANRWANTATVNQVRFFTFQGGNFNVGTTFSLYGIAG